MVTVSVIKCKPYGALYAGCLLRVSGVSKTADFV